MSGTSEVRFYHDVTPRIKIQKPQDGTIAYATVIKLFREGLDTIDIAARLQTSEAHIANIMAEADA